MARLRVAGPRVLVRLTALLASGPPARVRLTALKALEGLNDPHAIDPALRALADRDAAVAVAAVRVLRGWVAREPGTRVLEALAGLSLDRDRPAEVRLAALDALTELPRDLIRPLLECAPTPAVAAAPPDDPDAALEWLERHGASAPLSAMHALVGRLREREGREPDDDRRRAWRLARGAAHAALAARGSRVALYDLRETFDTAREPLPPDYLTAIAAIGDASCLEPLARAWAAADTDHTWWRERLGHAAADISKRAGLTGRSGPTRRIRAKWKGFL